MRLCQDCKHIYEEKTVACPACKSEKTVELHGVGIKADHESIKFHWSAYVWFSLCLVALIVLAGCLVTQAGVMDAHFDTLKRAFKAIDEPTAQQLAEYSLAQNAGNLLMVSFILSLITGVLYILLPLRRSRKQFFLIGGLTVVIVVLASLGQFGAWSFLPLALLPISLAFLLPHWDRLR